MITAHIMSITRLLSKALLDESAAPHARYNITVPPQIRHAEARGILSATCGFIGEAGFTYSLSPARNCTFGCTYCALLKSPSCPLTVTPELLTSRWSSSCLA